MAQGWVLLALWPPTGERCPFTIHVPSASHALGTGGSGPTPRISCSPSLLLGSRSCGFFLPRPSTPDSPKPPPKRPRNPPFLWPPISSSFSHRSERRGEETACELFRKKVTLRGHGRQPSLLLLFLFSSLPLSFYPSLHSSSPSPDENQDSYFGTGAEGDGDCSSISERGGGVDVLQSHHHGPECVCISLLQPFHRLPELKAAENCLHPSMLKIRDDALISGLHQYLVVGGEGGSHHSRVSWR